MKQYSWRKPPSPRSTCSTSSGFERQDLSSDLVIPLGPGSPPPIAPPPIAPPPIAPPPVAPPPATPPPAAPPPAAPPPATPPPATPPPATPPPATPPPATPPSSYRAKQLPARRQATPQSMEQYRSRLDLDDTI
ncbi:MAG: hypothetical protein Q9180_008188 [Flavoplaca navasiana]